jgi:hypothetical protein
MANKDKYFVPYQPSIDMKSIEFDEPCFGYFEDNNLDLEGNLTITFPSTSENGWKWVGNSIVPVKNTLAPLYQQAFEWFMDKHNLFGCVDLHTSMPKHWYFRIDDIIANDYVYHSEDELFFNFKTYKDARIACLNKLIQIVKNK